MAALDELYKIMFIIDAALSVLRQPRSLPALTRDFITWL